MAVVFSDTQTLATSSGAKMLVYGPAGAGKTLLAATLPSPVLISAESGLLSLSKANIERTFGVNTPGISYNIPVLTVDTYDDVVACYNWLISPAGAQFQSIGLDSISEIAEKVLIHAKKGVKDPRQAYGALIEKMLEMVRLFRDIPGKNVYMSSKMEMYKDEMTGSMRFGPMMPGAKVGPALPYFFDEVFHIGVNQTQAGEKYRYLRTQLDIQYDAKDRSGALLPMEPPHLGNVINKILGV